jgi:excisionase family DNA binding protein
MKEQALPNIFGYPATPHQPPKHAGDALLYRIHTAEAKLGVSRSTIYRLVNDGELVLIKIGKRSSGITASSLHALIERNKAVAG